MDEATLFKAMLDAPDDEGPRAVYGDWLAEQGHPMAEFMELHARPESSLNTLQRQRAQDLLIIHGKKWIGALVQVVLRRESRFVHGFLHDVTASVGETTPLSVRDDWHWATVRTLDVSGAPQAIARILGSPWLKNLAVLRCKREVLANLTARPAWNLAELSVDSLEGVRPGPGWAQLQRLTVREQPCDQLRLDGWRVEELQAVAPTKATPEFLRSVVTKDVNVGTLVIHGGGWKAAVVPRKRIHLLEVSATHAAEARRLEKNLPAGVSLTLE